MWGVFAVVGLRGSWAGLPSRSSPSGFAALSPPVEARVSDRPGPLALRAHAVRAPTCVNEDLEAPFAGPAGTSEGTSDGPRAGTRRQRPGGRHTGAFQRVRT